MDPNNVAAVLTQYPFHVNTLITMADIQQNSGQVRPLRTRPLTLVRNPAPPLGSGPAATPLAAPARGCAHAHVTIV